MPLWDSNSIRCIANVKPQYCAADIRHRGDYRGSRWFISASVTSLPADGAPIF